MNDISARALAECLKTRFSGTVMVDAWGETSLFYNPDQRLPRGVYFATVKSRSGDNDKASGLDREGAFRLNVGTTRALFEAQFGQPPKRPVKGMHIEGPWDFTARDILTPHPVYGWMSWVSIITPSAQSIGDMSELIDAAYAKAKAGFDKRIAQL